MMRPSGIGGGVSNVPRTGLLSRFLGRGQGGWEDRTKANSSFQSWGLDMRQSRGGIPIDSQLKAE
jgi:hypothetical protein